MPDAAEISLTHLDRLTDSTGLIQHAIYCLPRRESGYTIDDNARALRLCVRLWQRKPGSPMLDRVARYMSMLEYARRPGRGFYNLMSYQRQWLDTDATGDCQGQAVRALAEVLASKLPDDYRVLARELIETVVPTLAELKSLRAQAYVILACGQLWNAGVGNAEALDRVAWNSALNLAECYGRSKRPDWHWYESRLTYANAVLPHALFVAARQWPRESFLEIANESFAFLDRETTVENVFWPVGNNGWYSHGESKASYDQQPVEAVTMADAALCAFEISRAERYAAAFRRAYGWFYGKNSVHQSLIDPHSGSCCDGLQAFGRNRNQGAESTLAFLWTEVHRTEFDQLGRDARQPEVVRI